MSGALICLFGINYAKSGIDYPRIDYSGNCRRTEQQRMQNACECANVRLLLVSMLATQHTDFESFANALGALPNQPPVPMECEPSPSPIDVDTKAIVHQVVDVLLKHSPSPAVHLEVLGRRWLALARNESVTNLTSTLSPAKVPAAS